MMLVKVCVGIEGRSSFPSGWWGTAVQGECRKQTVGKVLWSMYFQTIGNSNLLLQLNSLRKAVKVKK